MVFDKRQTNIAKGVALLLLLWHHLFYNVSENYSLFTSIWVPHTVPVECIIARFCRVCVAIFMFLSGFGLYRSWQKNKQGIILGGNYKFVHHLLFVMNHLLKLLFNYWFVFVIFVPLGIFFGRAFWTVYGINPLNMFLDFIGLSNVFQTPTMNETWWFMSAIIIYYVLFPVLLKVLEWSPETLLVVTVVLMIIPNVLSVPVVIRYFKWLPSFALGMYFANQSSFDRIQRNNNSYLKLILLSSLLVLLSAFIRFITGNTEVFDAIFALSIIMFSFFFLSRVPIICIVLEHLGKNSGSIFMFHTFIYSYYFKDFIYWFKYAPVIMIVMTVACYAIAVGLEYLKRLVRYDRLVSKVLEHDYTKKVY